MQRYDGNWQQKRNTEIRSRRQAAKRKKKRTLTHTQTWKCQTNWILWEKNKNIQKLIHVCIHSHAIMEDITESKPVTIVRYIFAVRSSMFNVRTQLLCCTKMNLIFVQMLAKSCCKFFCLNQTLKFFVCFFFVKYLYVRWKQSKNWLS